MTRIVVIDEDTAILDMFCDVLADEGIDTVPCLHHADALACVRDTAPDAVILDVHRDVYGRAWSALAALHADAGLHAVPVLVCTVDKHAVEQHAAALRRDGDAVLMMPFDLDTFFDLVHRLLGRQGPALALPT